MNIGLEQTKRVEICNRLNHLLADEFAIYLKTLKYHWNIRGEEFFAVHELLDRQYKDIQKLLDDIAERTVTLGSPAKATLVELQKETSIPEDPAEYPNEKTMLANLHHAHEQYIRELREAITAAQNFEDYGTADMLTKVMEDHEKMDWMIRSHLER